MHREGADPHNMTAEDFLCDFCGQHWREDRPFVEGHRGSCICGACLTVAYAEIALHAGGVLPGEGEPCALCLMERTDVAHWRSPVFEDRLACVQCVKRSAGVLHKDEETGWRKPVAPREAPTGSAGPEEDGR
jgi:hypothetical protein